MATVLLHTRTMSPAKLKNLLRNGTPHNSTRSKSDWDPVRSMEDLPHHKPQRTTSDLWWALHGLNLLLHIPQMLNWKALSHVPRAIPEQFLWCGREHCIVGWGSLPSGSAVALKECTWSAMADGDGRINPKISILPILGSIPASIGLIQRELSQFLSSTLYTKCVIHQV